MRHAWLLSWLCAPSLAFAQEKEVAVETPGEEGFEDLDLDSLLSLEVGVASFRATTLRESPGIVTVVTRDEILASGARDLIDVLRMVPGFFFAVDVQGVVGIGIRGQWAHEGKVLLMIDGQEMNEMGFQTLQLGHHYPVENIERVEIIRGPGSAIYGGNAELGVVKVITRGGDTLRGGRASVKYGAPRRFFTGDGDKIGYGDLTLEAGSLHGDFEWSISGFIGRSVRSDFDYTASDGTVVPMGKVSELLPAQINASAAYGKTRFRILYDHYRLESIDSFDAPTVYAHDYIHSGLYTELTSDIELAPGLRLIPKASYRQQRPWYTPMPEDPLQRQESIDIELFFQQTYHRLLGNVMLSWDAFDTANIAIGVEGFYDLAAVNQTDDDARATQLYIDDEGNETSRLSFATGAFIGEFSWPNPYVNFTIGGRLEIHSEFGVSAVPRIALTKVFDFGLHAKLLAAQAFRMPGFQNKILEKTIDPENDIKPERTSVLEAEIGYQIPSGPRFTINGFLTSISNPVIYVYDEEAGGESYFNRGRSSTIGGEFEARWVFGFANLMAAYAYYQALGTPIEDYVVEDTKSLLGAPRHRLIARTSFELFDDLFVTPHVSWAFDRYAILGEGDPEKMKHEVLLGLAVMAMNVGVEGLDLSLIAHDLIGQGEQYPQPYRGGHSPLPGPGRQVMFRLSFEYGR